MGEAYHEVDSITDCKDSFTAGTNKSELPLRLKVEMCCSCHKGRSLWFTYAQLMQDGNKALQNLTIQTVDMFQKGFEIKEHEASRAIPQPCRAQDSDNFSMNDEDNQIQ